MARVLRCFAEGSGQEWQAYCLDLDIAVQGQSFAEVEASLQEAIRLYVESLADLSDADRIRLLNRPVPLWQRLNFAWRSFASALRPTVQDSGQQSVMLACHA
jgi:hypothetical protein